MAAVADDVSREEYREARAVVAEYASGEDVSREAYEEAKETIERYERQNFLRS